jgi:DNA-binding MarR family transcriptional regulator
MNHASLSEEVLTALRRIVRAIDLHSRQLVRRTGLTGPQTLLLKALVERGECTVTELADRMNLSQATVTDILNRLERRGLLRRERSIRDRRCVRVLPTAKARKLIESSPPLLQDTFLAGFQALQDWEQMQLLASLQRIADMMHARGLDASPLLSSGPITADAESPGTGAGGALTADGARA